MAATLNPQTRGLLETLQRVGTPPGVLTSLERYATREVEIRGQQYKADKEAAELNQVRAHTVEQLRAHIETVETEAAAQRDAELQRVDNELRSARAIPTRQLGETSDDYLSRTVRRQLEEQRDLMAVTAAAADVSLALAIKDPEQLEQLVAEAIDGGHPEHIRRVSRAVQLQLGKLARVEMAKKASPGAPRPSAAAAFRVDEQVRHWRAKESAGSPAVRKQRIQAAFQTRVQEARHAVLRAGREFGLQAALETGLTTQRHTGPLGT